MQFSNSIQSDTSEASVSSLLKRESDHPLQSSREKSGVKHPSKRVRIVIPAYGSMTYLPRCIKAIHNSKLHLAYEIVIVDNGENNGIESLVDFGQIQIIRSSDRQNASVARNIGTQGFDGDIIVFIDSDVEVATEGISNLIAPILNKEADATFGNYSHDGDGLNYYQRYKLLYISRVYGRKTGHVSNFFWTAFGAVRTDAFLATKGFDPCLPGHIGEDVELGQQLTALKYKILNVPSAVGLHFKKYSFKSLILNDLRKGVSTIYLSLASRSPLSNNPHATKSDIYSVFFSSLPVLGMFGIPLLGGITSIQLTITAALFVPYILSRQEFGKLFQRERLFFKCRSFVMMYCLDVVRLVSIGGGIALFIASKFLKPKPHY